MEKERKLVKMARNLRCLTFATVMALSGVVARPADLTLAYQSSSVSGSIEIGGSFQKQEKRALRLIFVHGWQGGGSSPEDRDGTWVDSVKDFTQDNGMEASFPDLPGGSTPTAQVWKEKIREEVQAAIDEDRNVLLFNYSLGARATLLFVDACIKGEEGYSLEMLDRVSSYIFLAPLSNDRKNASRREGAYADFFETELDMKVIKEVLRGKDITIVHSKDDPQVPIEHGRSIARDLDAPIFEHNNRGHYYKYHDGEVLIPFVERAIRTYVSKN